MNDNIGLLIEIILGGMRIETSILQCVCANMYAFSIVLIVNCKMITT